MSDDMKLLTASQRIRNTPSASYAFLQLAEASFGKYTDEELITFYQTYRFDRTSILAGAITLAALVATIAIAIALSTVLWTPRFLVELVVGFFPAMCATYFLYTHWKKLKKRRAKYELVVLLLKKRGYDYIIE